MTYFKDTDRLCIIRICCELTGRLNFRLPPSSISRLAVYTQLLRTYNIIMLHWSVGSLMQVHGCGKQPCSCIDTKLAL